MTTDAAPTVDLQEITARQEMALAFLQERIAELELALDAQEWQRLSADGREEFSRDALRKIVEMSRLAYLKNPLINRAVSVQAYYVWGQGVEVQAEDETVNEVIQSFWDHASNRAELTGAQARELKEVELQTTGNLFLALFPSPDNGATRVRSIPFAEITDIITDPQDRRSVWFYVREWEEKQFNLDTGRSESKKRKAYYPDLRNYAQLPASIGGAPVETAARALHVKVGGFDAMRFGVPETYSALDWARAFKEFLEDWATIVRAYSRFAWNVTTKAGARGVAALKSQFNTTMSVAQNSGIETNPPPTTGAAFIASEGVKIDPVRTSGATTSAEDGRQLRLMVASAFGLPETFFGDADVGNHATSKTLDRPTELKMLARQELWSDTLRTIFDFVIDASALSPGGKLSGSLTLDDYGVPVVELADGIERTVHITFPPLLDHDPNAEVDRIVAAATLAGHPNAELIPPEVLIRLLLTALGVEDLDEKLDEYVALYQQAQQMKADMAAQIAQRSPDSGQPPDNSGDQPPTEAGLLEAVRHLRELAPGADAGQTTRVVVESAPAKRPTRRVHKEVLRGPDGEISGSVETHEDVNDG